MQPNDPQKKEEVDRELLFQKRIAELGFQRQQLPWNVSDKPVFELPLEETKLYSEREFEADAMSEDELERRVLTDLASQTYNFRTFYKRLHYELRRARRYQRLLSVMLVGIDRLEFIQAQYGLEAGDSVVRAVAKVLMSCIRDVDIAGRCREDTFGVILPETGIDGAEVAAERVRTKLEKYTVRSNWATVTITSSVGVACFPGAAQSLDEFFAQAAEALLTCMQRGGNAVVFAPQRR